MTYIIPGLDHSQSGGMWVATQRVLPDLLSDPPQVGPQMSFEIGDRVEGIHGWLGTIKEDLYYIEWDNGRACTDAGKFLELVRVQPESPQDKGLSLHPNTRRSGTRRWSDRYPLAFPSLQVITEEAEQPVKPVLPEALQNKDSAERKLHPNKHQAQPQASSPGSWVEEKFIKRGGKLCGPYLYLRWRDENGRSKSKYLGKP